MDGILTIKYKNKNIIPFECWDDIPSLLAYFLNALEDCLDSKMAEFFYPNQPLRIKLELKNQNIIFTFEEDTYKINKDLFLNSFLDVSKSYFNLIHYEFDRGLVSYEINKINKLYKLYNLL